MKNKLKKSKIIVPALALITATTAASVTGTVAWFTASRAATVTATSFKTTTLSSNLNVQVSEFGTDYAIGATTSDTEASGSGSVTIDGYLTHGSYAADKLTSGATATDANLYTPLFDSTSVTGYASQGRAESEYTAATLNDDQTTATPQKDTWKAGTKTESGTAKNIWYAVAWKMTFTVDASMDGVVNTLHFDPATTTFTDTTSGGTTINGLRVALMSDTNFFVAAGDNTKTHVLAAGDRFTFTSTTKSDSTTWAADTYFPASGVNKAYAETEFNALANDTTIYTRAVNEASFDNNNFVNVVSTTSMTYPKDGDSDLKTKASNYYLGDIDTTNGLTVIAVAWFEGTDASIVTSASTVMSDVTANLAFFSRTAA